MSYISVDILSINPKLIKDRLETYDKIVFKKLERQIRGTINNMNLIAPPPRRPIALCTKEKTTKGSEKIKHSFIIKLKEYKYDLTEYGIISPNKTENNNAPKKINGSIKDFTLGMFFKHPISQATVG